VSAPHTYCGSIASAAAIAEHPSGMLGGLEPSEGPHTVLVKAVAERIASAREGQLRGRGRTRPAWSSSVTAVGAGASVHAQARAQGDRSLCADACSDAALQRYEHLSRGSSPRRPVRPQAHPLRSLTHGGTCLSRTRYPVSTDNTPRARVYARGPSRPCLCPVFALRVLGPSAPPGSCAGTARRRRRRPM